jgi:hypothetical protein
MSKKQPARVVQKNSETARWKRFGSTNPNPLRHLKPPNTAHFIALDQWKSARRRVPGERTKLFWHIRGRFRAQAITTPSPGLEHLTGDFRRLGDRDGVIHLLMALHWQECDDRIECLRRNLPRRLVAERRFTAVRIEACPGLWLHSGLFFSPV